MKRAGIQKERIDPDLISASRRIGDVRLFSYPIMGPTTGEPAQLRLKERFSMEAYTRNGQDVCRKTVCGK